MLLDFIDNLGNEITLSELDVKSVMKFIQVGMYGGDKADAYMDTRIKVYHKQKSMSSVGLPPDPESCKQAILHARHQT